MGFGDDANVDADVDADVGVDAEIGVGGRRRRRLLRAGTEYDVVIPHGNSTLTLTVRLLSSLKATAPEDNRR
jgi:hypothetical protein